MVDITYKSFSLREAIAEATVSTSPETILRIRSNQVPKGNVLEIARAAGLLGVKKTAEMIPDCHPLPIEGTVIEYELAEDRIHIRVLVKTLYRTGVEVEAMHGASIVALTMYDMLKPIDKEVEIQHIRLLNKRGGKSANRPNVKGLTAKIVVCSDSIFEGKKEDRAGKAVIEILGSYGLKNIGYEVISDEPALISEQVQNNDCSILIFCGGTGVGPRDHTPDVLAPLIETRLPGVEEAIRKYGQERMPLAMLSRSIAGIRSGNLLLAVPGSTAGATESVNAIFPGIFHLFHVLKGQRHD